MDYQQMYQNKLTTAASAANVIQSGDWVDYGWCVNTPVAVDKEVAKRLRCGMHICIHRYKKIWQIN